MRIGNFSIKSTKIVGRFVLIVFLVFCMLLSGFAGYESDNLYAYQWAYKNLGTFSIDRGILADNHNIIYFNQEFNDLMYQDSSIISYIREHMPDIGVAYAIPNVDINWEDAYKVYKSIPNKRNAIVAIIDSGVDINHYELIDNIWTNDGEIPGNGVDDDLNGYIDDVHGYNFYDKNANVYVSSVVDIHGTHAAGTIVAKHDNGGVKGIAYDPAVKVMPLKILGENGKGSMSSLVEAIRYAKANGANICNISLGAYTYDASLEHVIKEYSDMIFIVAAGNGANFIGYSLDERNVYPAKFEYPNVITVSNVAFDGTRYVSANYGSYVDIFAPGTFILSTAPESNFGFFTGTSMAAPFVTATCAMLYSAYRRVPTSEYKNIIVNTATTLPGLYGQSKSGGMLNIANALLMASTF